MRLLLRFCLIVGSVRITDACGMRLTHAGSEKNVAQNCRLVISSQRIQIESAIPAPDEEPADLQMCLSGRTMNGLSQK